MAEIPNNERNENTGEQGQNLRISLEQFLNNLKKYVVNLFNVQEDIDKSGAIESIKKDVELKGFNVWILISSIIICSIGLNLNSTAVIIGAMLISPLMGPITGIGFSVATFDHGLWVKSLKNLANTVVVSVLTSYLFFKISPEGSNSSELLARTNPTILDLLVALFGGVAGILASTRRIKTNVIPGVAIATALMPPLCTAGFGLATMQFNYFFGAIYLFFINSVFISLAALLIVRYLKFQPVTYINPQVQKKARNIILVSVAIISIPSIILYYQAMKKTVFEQRAMNFINTEIKDNAHWFPEPHIISGDSQKIIRLYVYGEEIKEDEIAYLNRVMQKDYKLTNTKLEIENMGEAGLEKIREEMAQDEVVNRDEVLNELKFQIAGQNKELNRLKDSINLLHMKNVDLNSLLREVKVQYECIETVEYGLIKRTEGSKIIEEPTFFILWNESCSRNQRKETLDKVQRWLTVKYKDQLDSLKIEVLADK